MFTTGKRQCQSHTQLAPTLSPGDSHVPGASGSQQGSREPEGRDSAMSLQLSSHPQHNLADEVPKTAFWIQRTAFPFPQGMPMCPRPSSPVGESSGLTRAQPHQLLPRPAMKPPPRPAAEAPLSPLFEEAAAVSACLQRGHGAGERPPPIFPGVRSCCQAVGAT